MLLLGLPGWACPRSPVRVCVEGKDGHAAVGVKAVTVGLPCTQSERQGMGEAGERH